MTRADVEARFERVDNHEGAVFNITPAAKPGFSDVLDNSGLTGLFIRMAWSGFAFYAAGLFLIFFTQGNLLSIALGLAIIVGHIAWSRSRKTKPDDRTPEKLIVNKDGITSKGRRIAAKDVVELFLRVPGDVNRSQSYAISSDDSVARQQANFHNLQAEVGRRNLALMARLKSSSEPVILVERLTPYVGESLMNDVWEAMRA